MAFGVFPNVLPSNTTPALSLTIYNAAAAEHGLMIGLWWFILGMALATAYSVFTYRHFAGKIDERERRAYDGKTTTSYTRDGAAVTPPGPGTARHPDLEQRYGVHSGRAPRIRAGRAAAPREGTLDRQLERVLQHLDMKPTDLERYI
jgi:hypothetical protein